MTSKGLFERAVRDVEVGVSRIRKTEFYGQEYELEIRPARHLSGGICQKPCVRLYKPKWKGAKSDL